MMKGYQRRALGKPDYWKVAIWNVLFCCWQDGKRQFDSKLEAKASPSRSGRYRLSFIADGKSRQDVEEFTI